MKNLSIIIITIKKGKYDIPTPVTWVLGFSIVTKLPNINIKYNTPRQLLFVKSETFEI